MTTRGGPVDVWRMAGVGELSSLLIHVAARSYSIVARGHAKVLPNQY